MTAIATRTIASQRAVPSRSERFTWNALRVAAVAMPVLGAVTGLLHPSFDEVEEIPELATEGGWYALHFALLVMGGFMIAAAAALSKVLLPARPLLTTVGAWLLTIGAVAWIALMGFELALPTLAEDRATWDSLVEFMESGAFAPFFAGFVLTALGGIILGIAALRDVRRPRWQGALVVAGSVLTVPDSVPLNAVGALALAGGIAAVLFLPTTAQLEKLT